MGLLTKENNFFRLDIGTTAMRLVQLRGAGGRPLLVTQGDVSVTSSVTASDSTLERTKLAQVIAQLVSDSGVSTNKVVIGLPSSTIFASVINTPKLSEAELGKAIKYQADQYIPMPLDQVKLDWSVIGPTVDQKELEVLLVAAPVAVTDKYLAVCEQAGLEIVALEANALAVSRALVSGTGAYVVLDVGAHSSDLTLMWNKSPRLMRSIPVGGSVFTKTTASALGLDETQAQQFAFRFGLSQSKLEGQVAKALKATVEGLGSEIDKSVKFFTGRYPSVKFEKLILTGTGSTLPQLDTALGKATGLPVEFGNAWANIAYPTNMQENLVALSTQYAAAAGLAERGWV